ncbi:MAG: hypothetical protein GY696_15620 [Gammaproteobacteria bacterium]|nr:hypothetical protein [Gammaproteobacteria bacterium]
MDHLLSGYPLYVGEAVVMGVLHALVVEMSRVEDLEYLEVVLVGPYVVEDLQTMTEGADNVYDLPALEMAYLASLEVGLEGPLVDDSLMEGVLIDLGVGY